MKFRIVFIGNTGKGKELETAAREINSTANRSWLGLCCPDDIIEAEVKTIEEGKALMKYLYKKVGCFPKRYAWTDTSWWDDSVKNYLGHEVRADRYEYTNKPSDFTYPVSEEHFEDFLEAA